VYGVVSTAAPQATTQPTAPTLSADVSQCPGYELTDLRETQTGLTARLALSGTACNAFGQDVEDLTIQVTYETNSRLHVNIFDTANQQYTIPQSVIERPSPPVKSFEKSSDLVFNYDPKPFAFWITRRSAPQAAPLFDTRISQLPQTPILPLVTGDNSTALNGFPLVFEDQYLQIASALPLDTNIYGLGEVVAGSGFRRNVGPDGGTIQTMWDRDAPDPVDQNIYGSHPVYMEHRFDSATNTSKTHGVALLSAAGQDILLFTPPGSNVSLIEYRLLGGVLDFYFFSGPTPKSVIEQYGAVVGLPTWQPMWGFGFHLCRWGYIDIDDVRQQVTSMRAAGVPLEVMWNDIDLYHALRDFTADPFRYPPDQVKEFIQGLAADHQRYIPIVDPVIATQANTTDFYDPFLKGVEQDVWVRNLNGSLYIGQGWPGFTAFPDWFQNNTLGWWTEALRNWSELGIEYSGIWLDMNEANSFCDGSCGSGSLPTDVRSPPRQMHPSSRGASGPPTNLTSMFSTPLTQSIMAEAAFLSAASQQTPYMRKACLSMTCTISLA
jgi:alpha-glucosidase